MLMSVDGVDLFSFFSRHLSACRIQILSLNFSTLKQEDLKTLGEGVECALVVLQQFLEALHICGA